jgi:hypothetical protein
VPPRHDDSLTAADRAAIRASGRDPDRVETQLATLRQKGRPTTILRPATLGDGISRLEDHDRGELLGHHDTACQTRRVSSFIPASGSGTRMFYSLLQLHQDEKTDIDHVRLRASRGDSVARDAIVVLENIRGFAVWPELESRGCSPHSVEQILRGLFDPGVPRYHELPKGLLPFHLYDDGVRTAFAEHLHEAVQLTTDGQEHEQTRCDVHFTISELHMPLFERASEIDAARVEEATGVRCRVTFSVQSPVTDTIASDFSGQIRRDDSGDVEFQPGGHGALLNNLAQLRADVVLIKNIDNIARRESSPRIADVRRQICGRLLQLESQVHEALRQLRAGRDVQDALNMIERQFGVRPPTPLLDDESKRRYAVFQLDRPIRVCGVVSALDRSGGRPFWAETPNRGSCLQIVEGAEIDLGNPTRQDLFHASHHFNPVDIACSLRGANGVPFDLDAFAVPDRAIVARKVLAGVPSLVYEHPGLWNGAMGLWNTAFVEIPDFAFNPAKSIGDLWTPGHRL